MKNFSISFVSLIFSFSNSNKFFVTIKWLSILFPAFNSNQYEHVNAWSSNEIFNCTTLRFVWRCFFLVINVFNKRNVTPPFSHMPRRAVSRIDHLLFPYIRPLISHSAKWSMKWYFHLYLVKGAVSSSYCGKIPRALPIRRKAPSISSFAPAKKFI